jgi:hypothetical protein
MQSPQEFIESFLREKADMDQVNSQRSIVLNQKFFAEEYVRSLKEWYAKLEPEILANVEVSDTSAKVITVQTCDERQLRSRYLLRLSGSDWQIYGKEWECIICHVTGQKGTSNCHFCGGATVRIDALQTFSH